MEEMNTTTEYTEDMSIVTEDESTDVVTTESTEKDYSMQIIAGAIAVTAAAGYGCYQFGKNVVVPAGSKMVSRIKSKIHQKKKTDVIDAEGTEVESDDVD